MWHVYTGAMALKIREAHKERQDFTAANAMLKSAVRKLNELRNSGRMQFSRAEYLFLSTRLQLAQVQSAVVGQHDHAAENIMA